MIQLQGLSKIYPSKNGPVAALRSVDLTVADGEIHGIIGASGAGKSTLVRCINLLERPTGGRVLVDGEDLTRAKPARLREVRRKIGMIFQNFCLLEQRDVAGNVRFPLELAGLKRGKADERVKELLSLVGLTDKIGAYPSQLSGGQKQRVAIARALATGPRYLLCDEATSALDPATTASVLNLLKDINRTLGVTVVVVTHEMKVIEKICDTVSVIGDGTVAESGAVSEVFADPRSSAARELILPEAYRVGKAAEGEKRIRLIFDGERPTNAPIVSSLSLDLGVPVNILYADTRLIDGRTVGQMVISLPQCGDLSEKVERYLTGKEVRFREEN